jgi:hypothetical protein
VAASVYRVMRSLVVALAILTGCTGGHAPSQRAPADSASSDQTSAGAWVTYRDPQWLFEIDHPPSWDTGPLLVSHGDRRQWQMLALATYPLRAGGSRCPHLPVTAFENLGPRDAFLYVQEPEYVEGLPKRRDSLQVEFTTSADYPYEISVFKCMDDDSDFRYAFIPFSDNGRSFYAYLALGMDASDETRRDLLGVLDSLKVLSAEEFARAPDGRV